MNSSATTPIVPSMVDFHGFPVASEHKKYLKRVYQKEGEFWKSGRFKSKELISGALQCLGRILVISHTPWSDISEAELQEMLIRLDDFAQTGILLTSLASCTSMVEAFLKMRQDSARIQAKLNEANRKFNLLKQKQMELRKQLGNVNRLCTVD